MFQMPRVQSALKMPTTAQTLRIVRKVHLYSGLFIAPVVIFLSLTGAMQTLNLHEATPDGAYQPAHWMLIAAQVHKNQTAVIPVRKAPASKPGLAVSAPVTVASAAPKPAPSGGMSAVMRYTHHLPMKIFFLAVSFALVLSTLTGIYMGYRYERKAWVVSAWLIAGVVIPVILLRF